MMYNSQNSDEGIESEANTAFLQKTGGIIETADPELAVFGLYAGGPKCGRICIWDQPLYWDHFVGRDPTYMRTAFIYLETNFSGITATNDQMLASFRSDIDYQKFFTRTGFLVSKDSNLIAFEELISEALVLSDLLKENCYLIIDDVIHENLMNGEEIPIGVDIYFNCYIRPLIIVTTEGVKDISIEMNKNNPNYRNACYLSMESESQVLQLTWYQLEGDFELSQPNTSDRIFNQIMNIRDINDYVLLPMPDINRRIVLSLSSHSKFTPRIKQGKDYRLDELSVSLNIFVPLADNLENCMLMSTAKCWISFIKSTSSYSCIPAMSK